MKQSGQSRSVSALFKPLVVEYVLADGSSHLADGRRVTKDTPGVVRRERRTRKWYGRYRDRHGRRHVKPLSENEKIARTMLAKLAGDAQLAGVGLDDPFAEHRGRDLGDHLGDFERFLEGRGNCPEHVKPSASVARSGNCCLPTGGRSKSGCTIAASGEARTTRRYSPDVG